jgi:hypothetical protein
VYIWLPGKALSCVSIYKTKALLHPSQRQDSDDEFEETLIMRSLQDLLPSEQAKQGDELLKAAAQLPEQRKHFTKTIT